MRKHPLSTVIYCLMFDDSPSVRSGSAKLNRFDKRHAGFSPKGERPWQENVVSKSSARRTRRVFSAEFNARVALAALQEDKTLAEESSLIQSTADISFPTRCLTKPVHFI